MANKKTPGQTLENIKKNKSKFANNMAKLAAGEIKGIKGRLTVTDKLNEVKDQILLCKDGVAKKMISYAVIRQFLIDDLKLKVSEASLRKYCQEELDFQKTVPKK
jgi:hypothetical protein